jgi:parallel beta-helix repeat protein
MSDNRGSRRQFLNKAAMLGAGGALASCGGGLPIGEHTAGLHSQTLTSFIYATDSPSEYQNTSRAFQYTTANALNVHLLDLSSRFDHAHVWFAPGTYPVDAQIVPPDNTIMIGAGIDKTILQRITTWSGPLIRIKQTRTTIKRLTIQGGGSGPTKSVSIDNGPDTDAKSTIAHLEEVKISHDATAISIDANWASAHYGASLLLTDSIAQHCSESTVLVTTANAPVAFTIRRTLLQNSNRSGILVNQAQCNAHISKCEIADNNHHGISISAGRATITDCRIERNGKSGVRVGASASATINSNTISRNGQTSPLDGQGIEAIPPHETLHIAENTISENAQGGLLVQPNTATKPAFTPAHATISANHITKNAGNGIALLGILGATVSANIIQENNEHGILLSTEHCCAAGNIISGHATQACLRLDDSWAQGGGHNSIHATVAYGNQANTPVNSQSNGQSNNIEE